MKTIQIQLTLTLDDATTKTLVEILAPAIKQALGLTLSDEDQRKEARRQQSRYALAGGKKLPEDQGLLIGTREACKLLQVSARTLWQMDMTGRMPPPIRFGKLLRWSLEGLKKWIDTGWPTDPVWKKQAEKEGEMTEAEEAEEE